ncbi:unnamed protein product [Paramecium sonneborni]|uniref:Uncharacterized protein n=1 Tax=Paramecium sonneborni TaxID=65129 RepID=A0A8S1L731_9CILI|nr:unnamed protein product [Paramecium sonneborni]
MKKKNLYSSHQQCNSFSRVNSKQDLCIDSSYISKYLGKQRHLASPQKFMSTLYSNKFETNTLNSPISDRNQSYNQYKQLTKNYFQKKYMLMTAGNEKSIKAWKKYLINSLRKKIEDFFQVEKSQISPQIKRVKLKFGCLKSYLSDDVVAINEIVKQKVPVIDLIQEQDKLIKKNYHYLKNQQNVDYDTKMKNMIQQYEIIIDRIQREAFKINLPNYIQVKMENYNEFYDVNQKLENPFFSSKLYQSCQEFKFQSKKLVKNSQQISFIDNYQNLIGNSPNLNEIITEQLKIQNPQKPQIIQSNMQSLDLIKNDYISYNGQDEEIVQQKQINKQNQDRNKCQKHKYRIKKKQNQLQENMQVNNFGCNLQDHQFVDYMLSLNDVYDCTLEQFQVTSRIENQQCDILNLDEYEFVDTEEEKAYSTQIQWNDYYLLKNQ